MYDRMNKRVFLAAALALSLAGTAFAEPAVTGAPTTMRATPSGKAGVVQRIPANAEIDVSSCSHGWCYGSWRNRFGYIPAEAVIASPVSAAVLPPPVVAAPPVAVAPTWRWSGPYVGVGGGFAWRPW